MPDQALLYVGEALSHYGFPNGHPLSIDRQGAFWREAQRRSSMRRCASSRRAKPAAPSSNSSTMPHMSTGCTRTTRAAACSITDERVLAFGGGGYDLANLARGRNAVLQELI